MKKIYFIPTFKVYGFEPENEFLVTSPSAGNYTEDDKGTYVKPGGDSSDDLGAGTYRNNIWN